MSHWQIRYTASFNELKTLSSFSFSKITGKAPGVGKAA